MSVLKLKKQVLTKIPQIKIIMVLFWDGVFSPYFIIKQFVFRCCIKSGFFFFWGQI